MHEIMVDLWASVRSDLESDWKSWAEDMNHAVYKALFPPFPIESRAPDLWARWWRRVLARTGARGRRTARPVREVGRWVSPDEDDLGPSQVVFRVVITPHTMNALVDRGGGLFV